MGGVDMPQLRTPYFSFNLSGMGLASGEIGGFEDTRPSWAIFAGNLGGGFDANLQIYYARNEDPVSGAFTGMGGSLGYSRLWEIGGSALNVYKGHFHIFLSDAQLSVALGPAVLHRQLEGGGTQWGGALSVDVRYHFLSPFLDHPVVNPFIEGGVLIGGFGGEGEGGFMLAPAVKLGVSIWFF